MPNESSADETKATAKLAGLDVKLIRRLGSVDP